MRKVDLSLCIGDPKNPAAKNKPFMTITEDEIKDPEKLEEFSRFLTKEEIKQILECFK